MEPVVNDESVNKVGSDGLQRWWLQVKELDGDDWITVALAAVAVALVACLVATLLMKCVNRWLGGERDKYKRYLYDVINKTSSTRKKRS